MYSEYLFNEYNTPLTATTSQAVFTSGGYACLGFGLRTSFCTTGAALDPVSASCVDETPTVMRGAEFDMTLVAAGTTSAMPPMERIYLAMYDVDGDVYAEAGQATTSLFEVNAPQGAIREEAIDGTTTLRLLIPDEATLGFYAPLFQITEDSDQLVMASRPEALASMVIGDRLSSNAEFVRAASLMPQEGNLFSYASEDI